MTSKMTAPEFYLEKVVQTLGYSLIVPGTLVEMTFLNYFLLQYVERLSDFV